MNHRPARLRAVLALVLLAGCARQAEEGEVARIAFVRDLSAPDADEHAQPAFEAARLAVAMDALGGGRVELIPVDLAGDRATMEEVAGDPAFVAAIVGPGADGSPLAEAGVPTVSVSTDGPTPTDGAWRRFVAPIDRVADTVADLVSGTPTCVLSEAPAPDGLAELLMERIDGPSAAVDPSEGASVIRSSGCSAVAWAGSPDPGVELVAAMPGGTGLVGGDRLLDRDFRDDVGPAGEGTLAVCSCVDVSTSLDPEVLRFVQDYQSEFGTAPGPYAVEAWDATRQLLELLGDDAGRAELAASLAGLEAAPGLVGAYRFDPDGEQADPVTRVFALRDGRWVATRAT